MKAHTLLSILSCLPLGIAAHSAAFAQWAQPEAATDLKQTCAAQMAAAVAYLQMQGKSKAEAQRSIDNDAEGISRIDRASAANDLWGLENGKFSQVPRELQDMGRCWMSRRIAQLDGRVQPVGKGAGSVTQHAASTARVSGGAGGKEKRIGCLVVVANRGGSYGEQAVFNSCGDKVEFSFCYLNQDETSWGRWGCKRNSHGHYEQGSSFVAAGDTQVLPGTTRNTQVALAACESGALPFIVGLDFASGSSVIECK